MTRAGADGFYTDRYVPFDTLAADPAVTFNCGETKASVQALVPWMRRDLAHKEDVHLPGCADRKGRSVELAGCDERAMLRSHGLAVPPGTSLQVEIEVEAGASPANFWVELVEKLQERKPPRSLRPREQISLKAKERRTLNMDLALPQGSRVEARLGLATKKDQLNVHKLRVFHGEVPVETDPTPSQAEQDAGD
jgi:hypothetical protein